MLLLLGVIALFLSHNFIGAPAISNDSVQYLDAASHAARGDCLCTTLAHFDEQVAVGQMPIPFTHFAPGYPLLIAGLSRLGITREQAGYYISAVSYLATSCLFWYVGITLGATPWVLGLLGLIWITNSVAILIAGSVSTEALFTALFLAVAALIVADLNREQSHFLLPAALGVVAGALYAVRYAGLFVVIIVCVYLSWRYFRNRHTLPGVLTGLCLAALECLIIMIRNTRLIGSWRGGFAESQGHSVKFVVVESVRAFYHEVFGDRVVAHFNLRSVVFICALAASTVIAFRAWRSERRDDLPQPFFETIAWLAALVVIYYSGIAYAALHSIAADLERYFFPAYPLLLAIVAAASLVRKASEVGIVAALVVAILAVHSQSLMTPPTGPLTTEVYKVFKEDVQPGVTLERWLAEHVSSSDVLISTNGQSVHYVLNRPVVAVINPADTTRHTDEAAYHSLMNSFHSRYLLLFPGSKVVYEQESTPFLNGLTSGSMPSWLTLAAKSGGAEVFECTGCADSAEQPVTRGR